MFTAALFAIARTWKPPKYPSTDEWIRKMRSIYTVDSYSAMERNETGSFVVMWTDSVIQSEAHQKEKRKSHYECIVAVSRKMVWMSLFAGQEKRHRRGERTCAQGGAGRGG